MLGKLTTGVVAAESPMGRDPFPAGVVTPTILFRVGSEVGGMLLSVVVTLREKGFMLQPAFT